MADLDAAGSDWSTGPKNNNLYHWITTVLGPTGTPYEGDVFHCNVDPSSGRLARRLRRCCGCSPQGVISLGSAQKQPLSSSLLLSTRPSPLAAAKISSLAKSIRVLANMDDPIGYSTGGGDVSGFDPFISEQKLDCRCGYMSLSMPHKNLNPPGSVQSTFEQLLVNND